MYEVSPEKLQELNVLINEGGQIPSAVSDALAATQVAIAEGDDAKANRELNKAIEANKGSGAAWSNVQDWHDEVKGENGGTDPGESGAPMEVTPNDGKTYSFGPLFANHKVSTKAGGPGMFSFSTGSGNAWYQVWVNGTPTVDGGMDNSPVKKGDTIEFAITTPPKQDTVTYSINP